ncbi:hypothetical protein Tco_1027477, partial [Tanacetum coccineum]
IDATLRNLKFTNKGAKDPVYEMAIPMVMLSEEIKASADYLDYLTKSKGGKPMKGRGKGLLTKKGVEVVVEKLKTVRVPKKKRTESVLEETAHKDSNEEDLDHSKKLKGIETLFKDAQFMINMKKARKASKDDFILQQRSKRSGLEFSLYAILKEFNTAYWGFLAWVPRLLYSRIFHNLYLNTAYGFIWIRRIDLSFVDAE